METTTTITPVRNHRRTYSDEKGPGAFASLGSLPKFVRKTPTTKKQPVFRFNDDDDDEDNSEDESSSLSESPITTTVLSTAAQSTSSSPPTAVPFPRRSGSLSPPPDRRPVTHQPLSVSLRPSLTRGVSTPTIILSTGKPLKSSLKSSSSSPSVTASPVREVNSRQAYHTRAASAPATPNHIHKAVHFPDNKDGGLEDVRLFNRSAKPQAVSRIGGGEETETETEPEFNAFPFPRFSKSNLSYNSAASPAAFEINRLNPGTTSSVPAIHPPYDANVHLESIELSTPPQTPTSPLSPPAPHLTGTVLVRNIAFEKDVAVRFTLDDWQTTSEVRAKYKDSATSRPWDRQTVGDTVAAIASGGSTTSWDRFSFIIRLEDHAYKLHERVLWVVVRYTIGDGQQWWDNNSDANYRIAFKIASPESRRTVSAPESTLKQTLPTETFGAGFDFATSLSYQQKDLPPIVTVPSASTSPSPTSSTSSLSRGPSVTSKLNLSNYISPATSPTTSTLRPIRSPVSRSPQNPATPSSGSTPSPSENDNVLSTPRANYAKRPTFQLSAVKPDTGLTLRWPWGSSTALHSPHKLSPLSSPALTTPLPTGSELPTPQQEKPTDDLYQAMVQQWCFAQSPNPSPGGVMVG